MIAIGWRFGKLIARKIEDGVSVNEFKQACVDDGSMSVFAVFSYNGQEIWARAEILSDGAGSNSVSWKTHHVGNSNTR